MQNRKVDVIIPTYKPDEKFEKLIELLESQSYPIHQIIIMNTEEKYFNSKVGAKYNNILIEHISAKEFDHGGTRDMAARKSEAEILLFMTQDAVPADVYLVDHLMKAFDSSEIGAAYARQLPEKDCSEMETFTRSFNYPEQDKIKSQADIDVLGIKTYFCSNVCAAYRKELYDSLGGFIKHTIFNEDMIFAGKIIKSGMKIAYCASAKVVHSHNYSNMQQLRRNFDLAVSQKDNPEIFYGIKSEGEGIRLVLQTAKHCMKVGKPWLIIELVCKSGFKYIGYKLGLSYDRLPKRLIQSLTMNKEYWK